jgi:hypothetical protein
MEGLIGQLRTSNRLRESRSGVTKGHKEYYQAELELNSKLRTFAVNCSLLYGGHNTVQAQLKVKSKRGRCGVYGGERGVWGMGKEYCCFSKMVVLQATMEYWLSISRVELSV